MGSDSEIRRRIVMRRVMRALRHDEFRTAIDQNGASIVVGLLDDTIADVFASFAGKNGTLVAPINDATFVTVAVVHGGVGSSLGDVCDIHPQSRVGMLIDLLQAREGRPVTCQVVASDIAMHIEPDPGRYLETV